MKGDEKMSMESKIIVCIESVSYENRTPTLFEFNEDLPVEEIKRRIFDAFCEAFKSYFSETLPKLRIRARDAVPVEAILNSQGFIDEMEKRGFKKIEADLTFSFWGWNRWNHFWREESTDLDRELFEYLKSKIEEKENEEERR